MVKFLQKMIDREARKAGVPSAVVQDIGFDEEHTDSDGYFYPNMRHIEIVTNRTGLFVTSTIISVTDDGRVIFEGHNVKSIGITFAQLTKWYIDEAVERKQRRRS